MEGPDIHCEMEYNHKWVTSSKIWSNHEIKEKKRSCHMQAQSYFGRSIIHTHCLQLTPVPLIFLFVSICFLLSRVYSSFMFYPFWILKLLCHLGPLPTTPNFYHFKPAMFTHRNIRSKFLTYLSDVVQPVYYNIVK